ncbi:uncharacterized protein A1O9_08854 [Exophiala aquamarina CBS 119918]|uniref:Choline transporter n=1 Tax=Exophiala aquamarina CBS 119918 TaxID=1182545 RepID=A0A072PI53_9EURO|nr:uncharacterized protein A1O9_08854 [Exophiala aquamarina CBS 119918]KEF55200.1 hypothetical protein A1O9_08854 [Exophiala aquamarina CBS 119918]
MSVSKSAPHDLEASLKQMSNPSISPGDIADDDSKRLPETGHVQELARNFSLLSLAGTGILVGNVWPALGGSILVAIYNGGPPGVLYEFIAASCFYFMIAASLAELASAMPSSAGPYLWASVTPGKKYGRAVGFFAGWWNIFAWIFAAASMSAICANVIVQMYAFSHPSLRVTSWHVFITYLLITWSCCGAVCLFNKYMPMLNKIGILVTVAGVFITILVCAIMPSHGERPGHASSETVWASWTADIGYPNGFVFVAGMLNGSYAMGTPDSTSHLAEEIPEPSKNVPKAIAMQYVIGFASGLAYLIAILYAINDYDALFTSAFPIAEIYHQATANTSGTIGLLTLLLLPTVICVVTLYITCGRTLWALSRDGATPFPGFLGHVNSKLGLPANATLSCCALVTMMGCIYVGSITAFNAFVGSYVLMSTSSYIASLLPFLLHGRRGVEFGYFQLPRSLGFIFNSLACAFMLVWFVIYCFPYSLPTNAQSMNYSSLIWGGLTILVGLWWVLHARTRYLGIVLAPRHELA